MKIVFATRNEKKITELKRMLDGMGIEVLSLSEFPNAPEVEETGTTFTENAILKSEAISRHTGLPALSDDSGLQVDALGGTPGVYSARYAGENATDQDNLLKLLWDLRDVPGENRSARFVCVLALSLPDKETITFAGTSEGSIDTEQSGDGGFGYDPVFIPTGHKRTFAQMTASEKDALSHRGKAFEKLVEYLKTA